MEYLNRETEHRVSDGTRDGDRERERERQREREREMEGALTRCTLKLSFFYEEEAVMGGDVQMCMWRGTGKDWSLTHKSSPSPSLSV